MARLLTLVGLLVALALSMLLASMPTFGADNPLYDWTVSITTQHLERQFKFNGSRMENKVDRLDVDIYSRDNEKDASSYESMWYYEGKPLGLELFNQFGVEKGHGICIQIKHKTDTPTDAELKAAANAILRVWLDAHLNQSATIIVKVPSNSFFQIVGDLQNQGLDSAPEVPGGQDVNAPMSLLIQSETTGQRQRLSYR